MPAAFAVMVALMAGLLVAAGCVAHTATESEAPSGEVSITRGGKTIGKKETSTTRTASGREVTTRHTMRLATKDGVGKTWATEKIQRYDTTERLIEIEHRTRVGRHKTATTAQISGDEVVVRRVTPVDTREARMALPPDLRFDNGAALLADWDPHITPRLEFMSLDVSAPLIETVAYAFEQPVVAGRPRTLLRTASIDGQLRSVSRLILDEDGKLQSTEQPMMGLSVVLDTAWRGAAATSNPVRDSLFKSPYRISRDAMKGHIRYTFSVNGPGFVPPPTGEQRVTPSPDGFVLDVCTGCGPGLSTDADTLNDARRSTFWLQSDHPRVARLGQPVAASAGSDRQKMERLEGIARRRMEAIDFAGHYSAAEALARRAGDCTEGAVVLAALGRAAGIPTRVASGIVYSREQYHGVSHAFMPHAWTLAFVDGKWESFDIALGGFDTTHIALSISDGDPRSIQSGHQLGALLEWVAMTQVKQR